MYPEVAQQLWTYFTDYRPVISTTSDQECLFLSHGVRDYGRPITDSVIRCGCSRRVNTLEKAIDGTLTKRRA